MVTVNPVLRRSHTKSKNGCQTCRARRVKCDEFRPRCRNCLFTQRKCQYAASVGGGESEKSTAVSALVWPEFVDLSCQTWRETGEPPFPYLQLPISPAWHCLSMKNLRYLHHLAITASILRISGTSKCCTWWNEFSMYVHQTHAKIILDRSLFMLRQIRFVQLTLRHEFVAFAVLAHSAGRLAALTKSSEALEDFTRFRKLAIQSLRVALTEFSKDNADAVLCTSICLSDQENDWRAWKGLVEGISSIVEQMQPWIADSLFAGFIDQSKFVSQNQSPLVGEGSDNQADLHTEILQAHLSEGISSLNRLAACPKDNPKLSASVRQLRDIVRIVHENPSGWSAADQFRLLHPFAGSSYNSDISFIGVSQGDPILLSVMAHFAAVVATLDLAFPSVSFPVATPIRLRGIIEIDRVLRENPAFFCQNCKVFHHYCDLMAFPLKTLSVYRQLYRANYKVAV